MKFIILYQFAPPPRLPKFPISPSIASSSLISFFCFSLRLLPPGCFPYKLLSRGPMVAMALVCSASIFFFRQNICIRITPIKIKRKIGVRACWNKSSNYDFWPRSSKFGNGMYWVTTKRWSEILCRNRLLVCVFACPMKS